MLENDADLAPQRRCIERPQRLSVIEDVAAFRRLEAEQ